MPRQSKVATPPTAPAKTPAYDIDVSLWTFPPKDILSLTEAANLLDLKPISMYSLVARRRIPCVKILGRLKFLRSDLEALIRAGRRPARD